MASEGANYRLFLDMDGVFCDFEKQIQIMERNQNPDKKVREGTTLFWDTIFYQDPNFFANMDWMPGAKVLWEKIKDYLKGTGQANPIFLTGCPKTKENRLYEEAVKGKREWVDKHMKPSAIYSIVIQPTETDASAAKWRMILEGVLAQAKPDEIVMIFCRPEQKHFFNRPLSNSRTPLLLDDRWGTKAEWETGETEETGKTGVFLHHATKANQTEQEKKNAIINSVLKLTDYGLTKPFTGGKSSRKRKQKRKATKKRTPSNTSRRV